MQKLISKFFSVICHPMLMPLCGLYILAYFRVLMSANIQEFRFPIFLTVVSGTILLPLILIPFFMYFKLINSVDMEQRKERVLPLLLTFILYGFTFYWLRENYPFDRVLLSFMLSSTIVLFLLFVISVFWKISLHMAGLGGITGLLLLLSLQLEYNLVVYVIAIFLLSGIVGTARLLIGAHKPAQIYVGYFLGMLVFLFFMQA